MPCALLVTAVFALADLPAVRPAEAPPPPPVVLHCGKLLDRPGQPIVSGCLTRGLLVNCTADRVLRFLPPLVVGREEIAEGLAILDEALAA